MIKTTCIYDDEGHCTDMFQEYVDDDGPDYNPCDDCTGSDCDGSYCDECPVKTELFFQRRSCDEI